MYHYWEVSNDGLTAVVRSRHVSARQGTSQIAIYIATLSEPSSVDEAIAAFAKANTNFNSGLRGRISLCTKLDLVVWGQLCFSFFEPKRSPIDFLYRKQCWHLTSVFDMWLRVCEETITRTIVLILGNNIVLLLNARYIALACFTTKVVSTKATKSNQSGSFRPSLLTSR